MPPEREKCLQNKGFAGHVKYIRDAADPGRGEAPAAARHTASRSSGSSIPAVIAAASASSSGVGDGAVGVGPSSSPGDGTGPGAKRSEGGVASPTEAQSFARTSSSMRPSSKAQVEETVVTWSVPSRATRCGHAARAIADPTAEGQARVTAASAPASGTPGDPERAAKRSVEPFHQPAPTLPGVTTRSCAGARGSASAPVAVTSVCWAPQAGR